MGTKIASLYAEVSADTSKGQQSLKDFRGGLTDAVEGLTGLNAATLTAGGAIGVLAAGVKKAADIFVETGSRVRDLQEMTGATAEMASVLDYGMNKLGLDTGLLQGALAAATRKGLEPTVDGLKQMADQFAALPDPISQNKFLMDNFGRSGYQVRDMMESLAGDGFAKLVTEAERAGVVMSQQDVQATRELMLETNRLKAEMQGLALAVGREVIPRLEHVTGVAVGLRDAIDNGTTSWFKAQVAGSLAAAGYSDLALRLLATSENFDADAAAADRATEAAERVRAGIYAIPEHKTVTIDVVTRRREEEGFGGSGLTPEEAALKASAEAFAARAAQTAGQTALGGGAQHGADFKVPPGYPNDSFPVRVSSGERVIVLTPEQQAGVTNNFTLNYSGASQSQGDVHHAMRILELLRS